MHNNVNAYFFNEKNKNISKLTADTARIDESNNNFNANGNVVVVSDSGLTLKSKTLYWDHHYSIVVTSDSVQFTTKERDTLYGVGFESDMDLSHWKIIKPTGVTSRINN